MITGSCFRLRPPRQDDAPVMIAWFEDLEVTARLARRFPFSLEEEQEWLRQAATDANSVYWVIEYEGRPVGGTSIDGIDWANGHGTTGTVIGDKSCWGKGIGGEVMRLRVAAVKVDPLRSGHTNERRYAGHGRQHKVFVDTAGFVQRESADDSIPDEDLVIGR